MEGSLIILVTVCVIAVTHCRVIQTSKDKENTENKLFDGYKPFVSRPRYGYGKRSAEDNREAELYYELRDFSNEDKNLGDYVVLLKKANDADSDAQRNHVYRWRHMFRQYGRKKTIPRVERFGSIHQGKDTIRENRDGNPRWGRFGDEMRSDEAAPRWGRFGDEMRSDEAAPRWGRFGDETRNDEEAPRWGRFGDGMRSGEVAPRWGRFGGDEKVDRERFDRAADAGPRWGRFGGKRSIKVILLDNSKEEDVN